MKSKLNLKSRLELIEAHRRGEKVSELCRKFQISRVLFYRLLKRYNSSYSSASLLPRSAKPSRFSGQLTPKLEQRILKFVAFNPTMSVGQIHARIGKVFGVSRHAIQNVLFRNKLNRTDLREEFSKNNDRLLVTNPSGLSPRDRRIMFDMVSSGKTVSGVCRQFGISRVIFYRLKKRFLESGGEYAALEDKEREVLRWARQAPPHVEDKIKEIVAVSPELSSHKISRVLVSHGEEFRLGNHGVHNVLRRLDLNTHAKRMLYAQGFAPAPKVTVAPLYLPAMPMYKLRMLLAPFVTVPKLLFTNPKAATGPFLLLLAPLLLFAFFIKIIFTTPSVSAIGLFFAATALLFGLFFFIYSMKYYITILMVLRLAQSGRSEKSQPEAGRPLAEKLSLLNVDLSKVELLDHPFVSIHVALYNERRVVERLIAACTSQNWYVKDSRSGDGRVVGQENPTIPPSHHPNSHSANYELIIADDSTDETTEIAKQTLLTNGWKEDSRFEDSRVVGQENPTIPPSHNPSHQDLEYFVFTKPDAPIVKLIHRFARTGFKGAALQKALEQTDERAQYVAVFDGDFVPYPDTLAQFIKSFQETCGGLEKVKESNIAAIQGYQWHVLNKSQTWVTRGVRTEYAGSYVIERSGAEIYGGLKQIAGSVYCIRADVLRSFGWGRSITEDFELTLRLYEQGFKVAFTPYIQAPAEVVSTIKRLIRQRMRWAEGASYNIKAMLPRILKSKRLTGVEKAEFVYLAPYYLQAAFFIIGTTSWFISEAVIGARLPFWTAAFGWSLVFTNLLALPLMNIVGLFLEESDERDYVGILSFIALSYVVVPFQAYAAVKGFLEGSEGPWFRTPKTGLVTDTFGRPGFSKFFGLFGGGVSASNLPLNSSLAPAIVYNQFNSFSDSSRAPKLKHSRFVVRAALAFCLAITFLTFNLLQLEGSGKHNVNFLDVFNMPAQKGEKLESLKKVYAYGEKPTFTFKVNDQSMSSNRKSKFSFLSLGNVNAYAQGEEVQAKVTYRDTLVETRASVTRGENGQYQIQIERPQLFKPGKYTLEAEYKGHKFHQDFRWGVIAMNTTKSLYAPGENAKFVFGVVDDLGRTICNAKLALTITVPSENKTYTLSSANGQVQQNPNCSARSATNTPDYTATFEAKGMEETYQLHLEAETYNGMRETDDTLKITKDIPFEVERGEYPTRVFPLAVYPVEITIKPKQDFEGEIRDFLPEGFEVLEISGQGVFANGTISWKVNWQKDNTYTLKYTIAFPKISPAFYQIGPLTFLPSGGTDPIFQEVRKWQIAADAIAYVAERAVVPTGGAGGTTFSPATNTTQGNHLILLASNTGAFVVSSVTDTKSNTWQVDASLNNGSVASTSIASVYLTTALTTSDVITVTLSGAGTFRGGLLEEFSGLSTTGWFDVKATNTGADSTSMTTGTTGTTSQADELAIESFSLQATATSFTKDSAYSNFTTQISGRMGGAYRVLSATGTQSATGAFGNTGTNWAGAIATYKATAVPENWVLLLLGSPFLFVGLRYLKKRGNRSS